MFTAYTLANYIDHCQCCPTHHHGVHTPTVLLYTSFAGSFIIELGSAFPKKRIENTHSVAMESTLLKRCKELELDILR